MLESPNAIERLCDYIMIKTVEREPAHVGGIKDVWKTMIL